eukprot:8874659-Pyramimonas_sp.AAC.1
MLRRVRSSGLWNKNRKKSISFDFETVARKRQVTAAGRQQFARPEEHREAHEQQCRHHRPVPGETEPDHGAQQR